MGVVPLGPNRDSVQDAGIFMSVAAVATQNMSKIMKMLSEAGGRPELH